MSDIEKLNRALEEWNAALEHGDIERLLATADENVIICNENQPTMIGMQALRDKYGPRIEAFRFESIVDIQEIRLFGDFAVMVTRFDVKTINKQTSEVSGGSGRLVLGYCRDKTGGWKLALDADNNDGQA